MMTDISTAFGTALGTLSGDIFDVVGVALPIALGIVGLFMAVKFGLKFFKNVSKAG